MNDARWVLVVEDSPTTGHIVALTLRKAGFRPSLAHSVVEAQAQLHGEPPSVVITDLRLPDASGFALCRFLRGDSRFAGVKIILVSGVPPEELAEEWFPDAYDMFLEKPFSLQRLVEALRAVSSSA